MPRHIVADGFGQFGFAGADVAGKDDQRRAALDIVEKRLRIPMIFTRPARGPAGLRACRESWTAVTSPRRRRPTG